MTTTVPFSPPVVTVADLLERLGDISPKRVRFNPLPGRATEQDVIAIEQRENRLYELIDGVLVEKVMSYWESVLAIRIATALQIFVSARNLGLVSGQAGMMRLFPGLIRIPDVAFVSRERLHGGRPTERVPQLVPDLAVEVISEGNTPAEMDRKRGEYFDAGVRLVWIVEPTDRTVRVFTGTDVSRLVTGDQSLDGGDVIPGLSYSLKELFAEM